MLHWHSKQKFLRVIFTSNMTTRVCDSWSGLVSVLQSFKNHQTCMDSKSLWHQEATTVFWLPLYCLSVSYFQCLACLLSADGEISSRKSESGLSKIWKHVKVKRSLSWSLWKAEKKPRGNALCSVCTCLNMDIYMLSGNELCTTTCGCACSFQWEFFRLWSAVLPQWAGVNTTVVVYVILLSPHFLWQSKAAATAGLLLLL